MIGKIHLDGLPQGFDYSMVLPGQGQYYNPDFLINGERKQIEGYCTEIITEAVIDWLKNKRDPEKPVSYTHLDVYKRQYQYDAMENIQVDNVIAGQIPFPLQAGIS